MLARRYRGVLFSALLSSQCSIADSSRPDSRFRRKNSSGQQHNPRPIGRQLPALRVRKASDIAK
jgi:hypothetical protein